MLPHNARRTIMDPTTTFCPNRNCPARGQTGQGNIGIHSQKEQRFICHECHTTFSARKGTVFYRLRTSAETVVIIVTLLAHGCPLQAIVARSEEHTSELQSRSDLVCRLLLEKKKKLHNKQMGFSSEVKKTLIVHCAKQLGVMA